MRHAVIASWPLTVPRQAAVCDLETNQARLGTEGLGRYEVIAGFRVRSALRHLGVVTRGQRLVELGVRGVDLELALRDTCDIRLDLDWASDYYMGMHEWERCEAWLQRGLVARARAFARLYLVGRTSGFVRSGTEIFPVRWRQREDERRAWA